MGKIRVSDISRAAALHPLHTRFMGYAHSQLNVHRWEGPVSVLSSSRLVQNAGVNRVTSQSNLSEMDCLDIVFSACRRESKRDFFVFKERPKRYKPAFMTDAWNLFYVTPDGHFVLMDGHWKEDNQRSVPQLTIYVEDDLGEKDKKSILDYLHWLLESMELTAFSDALGAATWEDAFHTIALDAKLVLYTCLKRFFNEDGPLFGSTPIAPDVWNKEKQDAEIAFDHIRLILASLGVTFDFQANVCCELCEQWVTFPIFLESDADKFKSNNSDFAFQCQYAGIQCRTGAAIGLNNSMRTVHVLNEMRELRAENGAQAGALANTQAENETLRKEVESLREADMNTKAENETLRKEVESLRVQLNETECQQNNKPKVVYRKTAKKEIDRLRRDRVRYGQIVKEQERKILELKHELCNATGLAHAAHGMMSRQGELAAAMLFLLNPIDPGMNLCRNMDMHLNTNHMDHVTRSKAREYWRTPIMDRFKKWHAPGFVQWNPEPPADTLTNLSWKRKSGNDDSGPRKKSNVDMDTNMNAAAAAGRPQDTQGEENERKSGNDDSGPRKKSNVDMDTNMNAAAAAVRPQDTQGEENEGPMAAFDASEDNQEEGDPKTSVEDEDLIPFAPSRTEDKQVMNCIACGCYIVPTGHALPKAHKESNLECLPASTSQYHAKLSNHVKKRGCKVWAALANKYHEGSWTAREYAIYILGRTFYKVDPGTALTLANASSRTTVREIILNRFTKANEDLKESAPHPRLFPRKKERDAHGAIQYSSRILGIESSTFSKERKSAFLGHCKQVLEEIQPVFEKVPSSGRLGEFKIRQFINELNMAMTFADRTDGFIGRLFDRDEIAEIEGTTDTNAFQDDSTNTRKLSIPSSTIDFTRSPAPGKFAYYINGKWCCAAGELCKNQGGPEVLNTSHKCADCGLKVHSLICTLDREENDPYHCTRCARMKQSSRDAGN